MGEGNKSLLVTAAEEAITKAKIAGKQRELEKCNALKAKLLAERRCQSSQRDAWNRQYAIYQSSEIASQVVITNVFEGVCAEALRESMEEAINGMEHTKMQIGDLLADLDCQIKKLDWYMEKLEEEIRIYRLQF